MARSVPLSRFTSRVGGGSAFFVGHITIMKKYIALSLSTLFACAAFAQGSIDFKSAPIPMVLDLYAKLGGKTEGSPSLVLDGTKMEFHGANTNEWYKATFSLREDTTPKQLDVVVTDCVFPKYVGKTAHGIYKIEDGKLTLAANEPGNPEVPTSFNAQSARKFVFTQK